MFFSASEEASVAEWQAVFPEGGCCTRPIPPEEPPQGFRPWTWVGLRVCLERWNGAEGHVLRSRPRP